MNFKDSDFIPIEEEKLDERLQEDEFDDNIISDYSEIVSLLEQISTERKKYLNDTSNYPINVLIDILEDLFQKIQCFRFPLFYLGRKFRLFSTLFKLLIGSPHIEIIRSVLACFGISLEKYPEIKRLKLYPDIISAAYDAMDTHMSITVSPVSRILILSIESFDSKLLKKLKRLIQETIDIDQLNCLSQVIQYMSKFVIQLNDKNGFSKIPLNPKWELQLGLLLSVIDILIVDKRILEVNTETLINLYQKSENLESGPKFTMQNALSESRSVITISKYINQVEVENLFNSLNIIHWSMKTMVFKKVFLTYAKDNIEFYYNLADNPINDEILKITLKILCQIIRIQCDSDESLPDRNVLVKVFDLLDSAPFEVKTEALIAILECTRFVDDDEKAEFFIENGVLDLFQDTFESESITQKKQVLNGIRRLASSTSPVVSNAIASISEFFEEIEENYSDEQELRELVCVIHSLIRARLDPDF